MQNGDIFPAASANGTTATQNGDQTSVCHILGVYSLIKEAATGHGSTSRSYQQKTLWFVRRLDDDTYTIQALNANSVPSGPILSITKGDFIRNYSPEPGYYEKRCLPFIESLKKKLSQAEKCLEEENLDGAEKEFCKALLLDEKHPKANIELGKIYLQNGDGKKLSRAFKRILGIDALFQEQQRHLFNDFGICLRKSKHFSEAVAFYGKAIETNETDENLFFNIARALAESGDVEGARAKLLQALTLQPDFPAAKQFIAFLDQQKETTDAMPEIPLPEVEIS